MNFDNLRKKKHFITKWFKAWPTRIRTLKIAGVRVQVPYHLAMGQCLATKVF